MADEHLELVADVSRGQIVNLGPRERGLVIDHASKDVIDPAPGTLATTLVSRPVGPNEGFGQAARHLVRARVLYVVS
jgi:hypothetical protein